ncbi:MAG: hypothetical protein ACR2L2_02370 [Acidobacteriota bacterium]
MRKFVFQFVIWSLLVGCLVVAAQAPAEAFITRTSTDLSKNESMVLVDDGSKLKLGSLALVDRDSGAREVAQIQHIYGNNVYLKKSVTQPFLAGSAVLQVP